ncbi:D123-domain-containing protein [Lentinula edodes]|uniref:D123-domain-containing protein n=1 Tax=Lentinula edodes TaxID=5353 RepID=UPI001E8E5F36|nr:D123-domain-containing protein [Lentinula edodes]KAH7873161.1 D123-domain-containing protein [Lentinula edodes]KAJ3921315.1 D123-domain-containing protein [Lentinula edodes]
MELFPSLSRSYILAFQFSSWYPAFHTISIKSTIIRPLSQEFHNYLNADQVFVPKGSENVLVESTLSDDEDDEDRDSVDSDETPIFAFPELDEKIRAVVKEYGAVFPKLNFTSPKDASWILPASSPLKCTSPADVYLLLKSSDFISHDLSPSTVFDGCDPVQSDSYDLELVLRKWYSVDRSRELRCFVRNNVLLGISQRDTNYYDFLNDPDTQSKIMNTVVTFWKNKIQPQWKAEASYVLDLLLTRDLSSAHIVDFNPYAPRTDPLLFSYEELRDIVNEDRATDTLAQLTAPLPHFRVIDSPSHPAASCKSPANQHNMVPFEALSLSNGRDIEDFKELWEKSIKESLQDQQGEQC